MAECDQEDAENAVYHAKEAVEICRRLEHREGEAAARCVLARAYFADQLSSLALEAVQGALLWGRELRNRRLLREGLELLGKLHTPQRAAAALEQQAAFARGAGDTWLEVEALTRAAVARAADNAEAAATTAAQALAAARAAGDARGEARACRCRADVYLITRDSGKALEALAEARERFLVAHDTAGAAEASKAASQLHEENGELDDALVAACVRVDTYRDAGWREEEVQALLALAELTARASTSGEAVKVARDAAQLSKDLGDIQGEAEALLSIASMQLEHTSDLKECMRIAEQAQTFFRRLGDATGEARATRIACSAMLAAGSPTGTALERCRRVLENCQCLGDRRGEAEALQGLADLHQAVVREAIESGSLAGAAGTLEDALNLSLLAAAVWSNLHEPSKQACALLQLAGLYLLDDDGDASLQAAKESRDIAERLDDGGPEAAALLAMADAHLHRESWQEAVEAAEEAKAAYEEIQDDAGTDDADEVLRRAKVKLERFKRGLKRPAKPKPAAPKARAERGLWTAVVEGQLRARSDAAAASRRRREGLLPPRQPRGGASHRAAASEEHDGERQAVSPGPSLQPAEQEVPETPPTFRSSQARAPSTASPAPKSGSMSATSSAQFFDMCHDDDDEGAYDSDEAEDEYLLGMRDLPASLR